MNIIEKYKYIFLIFILSSCGPKYTAQLNLSDTKSLEERAKTYDEQREKENQSIETSYFSQSNIELSSGHIKKKASSLPQDESQHIGERENGDEFYFEFPEKYHRYRFENWYWQPSQQQIDSNRQDRIHKVLLPKSAIPKQENSWVFDHFQTDFYELLELSWKEPDGSVILDENLGLELPEGRSLVNSLVEYQSMLNSQVSSLPVAPQISKKIDREKRKELREILNLAKKNEISPNEDLLKKYCGKINRKPLEFISSDTPLFFTSKIAEYTFDSIQPKEELKRLNFCLWLPLILQVNEEILQERDWLTKLYKNPDLQKTNQQKLKSLAKKYRIETTIPSEEFFAEAFFKVDIVAPSMAIAQVTLEGGWTKTLGDDGNRTLGTKCNNYFSIYDFSSNREKACKASRSEDYLKHYEHLIDSVRDYITKVNNHPAYVSSRLLRLHNRLNSNISGTQMILGLSSYAEDPYYFRWLWGSISDNHLDKYDDWYLF